MAHVTDTELGLSLQDCMVGLLFAFMPVLAHKPGSGDSSYLITRLLLKCGLSFMFQT